MQSNSLSNYMKLVDEFKKQSKGLRDAIKTILVVLDEGRAPSEEDFRKLAVCIDVFLAVYKEIKAEALLVDSSVADDLSICDYEILFKKFETSRIEGQVKSLLDVLECFVAVVSESIEYQEALAPYQSGALETIELLQSDEVDTEFKLGINCEDQRMFLEAISMGSEELSSIKGEALLDSLDTRYSRKVVRGILFSQYRLLDNDEKKHVLVDDSEKTNCSAGEKNKPLLGETQKKLGARVEVGPEKEKTDVQGLNSYDMDNHGKGFGNKRKQNSVHEATSTNVVLNEADEGNIYQTQLKSLNKVKIPGNISAASFKKELVNMPGFVRAILPILSKFGAMSSSDVIAMVSMFYKDWETEREDDVRRALDILSRKSIISAFNTDEHGITYALSSYGRSLLDKSTIQKLRLPKSNKAYWQGSLCNHFFTADGTVDEMELNSVLAQTELAVGYCEAVRSNQSDEGFLQVYNGMSFAGGKVKVPVIWGYQEFECTLYPACIDVCEEKDVVFVSKDGLTPNFEPAEASNAFLVDGVTLLKWNGSWVEGGNDFPRKMDNESSQGEHNIVEEHLEPQVVAPPDFQDHEEVGKSQHEVSVNQDLTEGIAATGEDMIAVVESHKDATLEVESSLIDRIRRMVEQDQAPTDEELVEIARELLSEQTALVDEDDEFSNLVGAITLLAAAATIEGYQESKLLYNQLVLSTGLQEGQIDRTGIRIARTFPEYTKENEALVFSTYCLALFAPHIPYDYDLNNAAEMFLADFDEFFPSLLAFKPLLNELNGIRDVSPDEGFSDNVLDMMGNQATRNKRLAEMKAKAFELLNPPKIKAKLTGIPEFNTACFGKDSDMNLCMQVIEKDAREDADFVREVLRAYCVPNDRAEEIDQSAIEKKIDDEWRVATDGKRTSRIRKLGSEPRKKAQDGFRERLELMRKWLSYDGGKIDPPTLSKLKKKKESISSIVDELAVAGSLSTTGEESVVLKHMLKVLRDKLASNEVDQVDFVSFLKTGFVSLDDGGYPIIDARHNNIPYYEPWRNVMHHLSGSFLPLEDVRSLIFKDDSQLFDNLRQASHINKILNESSQDFKIADVDIRKAEEAGERATEKFQDSLEIAYAYGKITEIQKEELAGYVSEFKDAFFSRLDFGCWRLFLAALNKQVSNLARPQGEELRSRLENLMDNEQGGKNSSLLDEAKRLLDEENYTVVEDYLNRFDAGQTELTAELRAKLHDPDLFSEFISDEVFRPIYDICVKSKGTPLSSFGKNFLKGRYPSDWTTRQRESSDKLIEAWPVTPKRFKGETLRELMKSIGFNVRSIPELVKKERRELYRVKLKSDAPDRADYSHPISDFGTQIKSPMNVLVLYGNHTPQEIIDVVAAENIVGIAVVFINYPITVSARRQMAELFHTQKSRLTSFLLIDQVLALHLALHQETERMPLLLKCTLPFTYYQPFVRDGGPTADEMFSGRDRELHTIIDPNGASIVYGGRQLGKTALLERAKSLRMKPDDHEYAVYVSILNDDNEELAALAISDAMARAGLDFPKCSSLREVCDGVRKNMSIGIVSRLLLLIDESDKFLASISEDGYAALQPMVDLKRETKNNFKFVLAGLHNVSRMKNATSRNGILGQLGEPLCIKPLTPSDALQLISRPLTYLGFKIDTYPNLETILTSTNYYPGILQFFGYTLVETMTKQYGDYYRAADGNPPYELQKEQLGAIMNRSDLNNSIKEKFRWSLELDPRYFMIARCIALLCYDNDVSLDGADIQKGFYADEIKGLADDLGIICLEKETPQSYLNLLDEMVDMGILVRPISEESRYRLRRNSFLNIIGSDLDAVLEDIDLYNNAGDQA